MTGRRLNRKRVLVILTVSFGLAVLAQWHTAVRERASPIREREPITIALALEPSGALMLIAVAKNYFAAEGLHTVIKEYPSGVRALTEGLLRERADIASAVELPVTVAAVDRRDIRILAAIFSASNVNRVIARRSSGITRPEDLRGKRIATQRGSAVHFFLYLFLLEHGLSQEDIKLYFLKAEELPKALADGRIDAFSKREPYISRAQEQLRDDTVVFEKPGLYPQTEVVVARTELIRRRPEVAERVVRALLRADAFAAAHPQEVHALLAQRLGGTAEKFEILAPVRNLRVTLPQQLVLLMETEARWAVAQRLTKGTELPAWEEYIYPDALRALKPEAVTLID